MRQGTDEKFGERGTTGRRPYRRHTVDLRQRGFAGWWRRASLGQVFALGLFISFVLPMGLAICSLLGAYWWTGGR